MGHLKNTAPCRHVPRVILPAPQRPTGHSQSLRCRPQCRVSCFHSGVNTCQARRVVAAAASTTEVVSVDVSKDIAVSQQVEPQIPADIADSVVTLEAPNASAPGGKTKVYILGMSHVSKVSVEAVRSLIAAVKPEVVLVELCKDRVGLLMSPDGPRGAQLWNTRSTIMVDMPQADGWPTPEEVLAGLETQPGRPITTHDIEQDCVRLLQTGLFRNARPLLRRPSIFDAPMYARLRNGQLVTVPPLGQIEFTVNPRILPPVTQFTARVDSSLSNEGLELPEDEVAKIAETLIRACAKEDDDKIATPAVDALLTARRQLEDVLRPLLACDFEIGLRGVESGEVEAVIKAAGEHQGVRTGLEESAVGGEGKGIEPFRPQRGPLQISNNLRIPNLAKVLQGVGESAADFVAFIRGSRQGKTAWRRWTAEERTAAENAEEEDEKPSVAARLASLLTVTYARFQNRAGDTVGVTPGAAWRAALQAASENCADQVLLGDLPSDLAGQRLTEGILVGLSGRLAGAGVVAAASVTAVAAHLLPEGTELYAAGATAGAFGVATLPFFGPLLEIYLFSRKSAEQIEEAVHIKGSLQARGTEMLQLPGEDAIVKWPNAKQSIIDDRDAFMARTLWAAATGAAACPAYILDTSDGRHVWQLAQPKDAPEGCASVGAGAGEYEPPKGVRAVVGVVGSAHVGGIVREWADAADADRLAELLRGAPEQ